MTKGSLLKFQLSRFAQIWNFSSGPAGAESIQKKTVRWSKARLNRFGVLVLFPSNCDSSNVLQQRHLFGIPYYLSRTSLIIFFISAPVYLGLPYQKRVPNSTPVYFGLPYWKACP
ncbi:MAG: hypothetical protein GY820_18445 [Gammaproteobacteria bacterium]|nr:hypothetical protein [Gammaproteobacteria bacterium]